MSKRKRRSSLSISPDSDEEFGIPSEQNDTDGQVKEGHDGSVYEDDELSTLRSEEQEDAVSRAYRERTAKGWESRHARSRDPCFFAVDREGERILERRVLISNRD